ncbi:MAG: hypothetical protein JWQ76_2183 [Ramlibacter sp.]|nr:hypothetical protein [Ramlibacter sp.]
MSDFSSLEQSFALMPAGMPMPLVDEPRLYGTPLSNDVQPHEVAFRQLRGAREIGRILHLRNEIALPASALRDAGFGTREKKEMKSAWSAAFFATANTSAPFACCR